MRNIVTSIICDEFEKKIGKWQANQEKPVAMQLTFALSTDYDIEEGYRYLDILIYGHANYVTVAAKERWNVIPIVDFEYDESGEPHIKAESKGYRKGDTGWKLVSHHDSCWRDGVNRLMNERITSISWLFEGWYKKIDVTSELLGILQNIQNYNNEENLYSPDLGVYFLNDGTEIVED